MFHDGDLQSGISLAIQQQKLVACFVHEDDSEECAEWEDLYLNSAREQISSKTIILKINSGSQEAGFLSAFCPISKVPTLVIIHNGQVLEKLEGGIGLEEFTERLSKALGIESNQSSQFSSRLEQTKNEIENAGAEAAAAPSQPDPGERPSSQQDPQNVQELFPGRAERLESENQRRQATEKAERAARAKARRKEAENAQSAADDPTTSRTTNEVAEKERARQSWIMQQKQRKEEARQERQRILDAIESDKQERKARAQREKSAEAQSSSLPSQASTTTSPSPLQPSATDTNTCNLQIRLFDGSSIRNRFPSSATLASAVRAWISQTTTASSEAADAPYTFRLVLAPLPSRGIEASDEHRSLLELGLAPSSTLVLVPVQGYADAYAGAGGGGVGCYVGAAVGAVYGVVGGALGLLSSALSYVPGVGGGAAAAVAPGASAETEGVPEGGAVVGASGSGQPGPSGSVKVKVKTLADQRAEAAEREGRKAEFYNGNSSAFEGRKNDAEEDE